MCGDGCLQLLNGLLRFVGWGLTTYCYCYYYYYYYLLLLLYYHVFGGVRGSLSLSLSRASAEQYSLSLVQIPGWFRSCFAIDLNTRPPTYLLLQGSIIALSKSPTPPGAPVLLQCMASAPPPNSVPTASPSELRASGQ